MTIREYVLDEKAKMNYKSAYNIGDPDKPMKLFVGHHVDDGSLGIGLYKEEEKEFISHFCLTRNEAIELVNVMTKMLVE